MDPPKRSRFPAHIQYTHTLFANGLLLVQSLLPRIGFRENLPETHSFGGENKGFLWIFPNKPIHDCFLHGHGSAGLSWSQLVRFPSWAGLPGCVWERAASGIHIGLTGATRERGNEPPQIQICLIPCQVIHTVAKKSRSISFEKARTLFRVHFVGPGTANPIASSSKNGSTNVKFLLGQRSYL